MTHYRTGLIVGRFDPPHRVDVRHLGRVVRGTGTFLVEPAPGGAWFVANAMRLRARGLPQGRYRLVLTAQDGVGNMSAERRLGLRVVWLRSARRASDARSARATRHPPAR